jgi:hypothetical protein
MTNPSLPYIPTQVLKLLFQISDIRKAKIDLYSEENAVQPVIEKTDVMLDLLNREQLAQARICDYLLDSVRNAGFSL